MLSFYDKATPTEKALRYNLRHAFMFFADIYKGQIPHEAITATSSAISIAGGAIQLLDGALFLSKDTLHPIRDKLFGASKILSGATAVALSYAPWLPQLGIAGLSSATALAGPAFALSRLVDLTVSAIDFHYAYKELDLSNWLEERYKQLRDLNQEIFAREIKDDDHPLIKKRNALEFDIHARIFCAKQEGSLEKIHFKNEGLQSLHVKQSGLVNDNLSNEYKSQNKELADKVNQNIEKKAEDLLVKTLAFTGALLLAIAPFTGPAAPALFAVGIGISIGVGLYSGKKLAEDLNVKKLFTEVGQKLTKAVTNFKQKSKEAKEIPLAEYSKPKI